MVPSRVIAEDFDLNPAPNGVSENLVEIFLAGVGLLSDHPRLFHQDTHGIGVREW